MDAQQASSQTVPKTGTGRSRLWKVFFVVLIIGAVLSLGCIITVVGGIIVLQRSASTAKKQNLEDSVLQELKQPQKLALDAIAADSGARETLGDDIQDAGGLGRDGTGELDRTGTVLHFDVLGSKQKGRVTAPAAMEKGAWQITGDIEINAADGKTIILEKPGDKPQDMNLDL